MAHVRTRPIGQPREALGDDRTLAARRERLAELEGRLRDARAEVHAGWGEKYVDRVHAKGKLTARERIERLKDEGSRIHEVCTFVNHGRKFGKLSSPGAGVVTAYVLSLIHI